ncbi:MAG: diadenylate cyclase CdaA [Bacteriovoracaceae bacterium]|nr:diadenylate cyclase CdaA [Bacteriovoracaceae bacterium]
MGAIQLILEHVSFKDLVDVFIVSILIYQLLMIVHGTRALQMLVGIGVLFIMFWVGLTFKLYSLNWILSHFFDSFFIISVVLFQDQIRAALATVGSKRSLIGFLRKQDVQFDFEEIIEACGAMSREKVGALLVLERGNGLLNYMKTGTRLNANVHSDILYAVFQSSSPLHDGAILISGGQIAAAGCFLPLSKNVEIDRHLGTRHRAALGITEVTDAIALTVSEETGKINLSVGGTFYPCENESQLRYFLKQLWLNDKLDTEMPFSGLEEGM